MIEWLHCLSFAWNVSLVSPILLKKPLVLPILLFSSVSLHWSPRKAFLSLLAILWNSAFRWVYLSFSHLSLVSLFTTICKGSSDNHFAFLYFFFLGMVLLPVSCPMSWTSVHSSSGTLLSDLISWIYLSLSLYSHKGSDLGHIWMVYWFSLLFKFKSEFGNMEFMIWATVRSWSCFCWLYRASASLPAKNLSLVNYQYNYQHRGALSILYYF